jgi:hypothetical protein
LEKKETELIHNLIIAEDEEKNSEQILDEVMYTNTYLNRLSPLSQYQERCLSNRQKSAKYLKNKFNYGWCENKKRMKNNSDILNDKSKEDFRESFDSNYVQKLENDSISIPTHQKSKSHLPHIQKYQNSFHT